MKPIKVPVYILIALGAMNVHAQADKDKRLTIGVDFGRSEAHNYCKSLNSCTDSDTSDRFDVGFQFNNAFSIELGYTNFGTLFNSKDTNFIATQKAEAWTLSGIATLPFGEVMGVFGRVGMAKYLMNNEGLIQTLPAKDREDNKPYVGAGISLNASKDFMLRAEYQYYTNISAIDGSKDDVRGMFLGLVCYL